MEEQFERELLEEAKQRVCGQVPNRDWEIFVELTERGTNPIDLAKRFEMTRNAVDNVKFRIISRLKSELRKLEQEGPQEA